MENISLFQLVLSWAFCLSSGVFSGVILVDLINYADAKPTVTVRAFRFIKNHLGCFMSAAFLVAACIDCMTCLP